MLSIIVPAHNAQKTLPALLDSIFDQTHKDFELIVVDDCSTDNTVKIAKKYNCKLTVNDLEVLINALTILHMRTYYPLFGAPNFNEL